MLPVLKRYAGAVDDSQDAILQQMLTAAALEVQDRADRSVLACEMELRIDNNTRDAVRLYQTPGSVLSVATPDGTAVDYAVEGREVRTSGIFPALVIIYTTMPDKAEQARLMPLVMQYATALYDGQTDEVEKILSQC